MEAQNRCQEQGIRWLDYLHDHEIADRTARRHMMLAGYEPELLTALRAEHASMMRERRAKQASASRDAKNSQAKSSTNDADTPDRRGKYADDRRVCLALIERVDAARKRRECSARAEQPSDPLSRKKKACIALIEKMDDEQLDEAIKLLRKIK